MNSKSASAPIFRDPDLEAQKLSSGGGKGQDSDAPSFRTPDSHKPTSPHISIKSREEPFPSLPPGPYVAQDKGDERAAGVPNNATQPESGWKPWKPGGPYRTMVPESRATMEDWIKAMEASDNGMCKGWKDQIDTLIIFAGLFSATVTAFTVESYKWLNETPADTLARLQLRALLDASHDPAIDTLAPAGFNVSLYSVLINTLWFASLTLALAAVVVSILCKQWLHEYQRYENFTTEDSFLIHGLRYRGLQAWRVPEIIASIPILLQTALVLFLVGVLVLLWPLQSVVASITTAIVGLTFLFLGATTILPAIQYIYPKSDTQCAYKSSQSLTFFFISSFWLFDFSMFTTWATFDRWEVTCIYSGTGHTLSRVYGLLSNSIDVFLGIYRFLADASLTPTTEADLTMLSDFVEGLDASRRNVIIKAISQTTQAERDTTSKVPRRIEQLKGYMSQYHRFFGKLRPEFMAASVTFRNSFSQPDTPDHAYHSRIQKTFSQFLKNDTHVCDAAIFNRYVEHWVRSFNGTCDDMKEGVSWKMDESDKGQWARTIGPFSRAGLEDTQWDPDIASCLVELHSHFLKTDQFSSEELFSLSTAYAGLVESHRRHDYNPPPFTLLKDIRDWINRMPDSDLLTKVENATHVLVDLVLGDNIFIELPGSQPSDLEKRYLASLAQFLVGFHERRDVLDKHTAWAASVTTRALPVLRSYLDQHPAVSL